MGIDVATRVTMIVCRLVLFAVVVGLLASGHWVAALVLALVNLAPILYGRLSPAARARRQSREPIDVGHHLAFAVALIIFGLFILVRMVTTPGPVDLASFAAVVLMFGSWALAFRLITYRRLVDPLADRLDPPILVGTDFSVFSRLRAIGLDGGELVTIETSVLGEPQTITRVSPQEVAEVEQPERGSVRLNFKSGECFWVRRGSPSAAEQLAERLAANHA